MVEVFFGSFQRDDYIFYVDESRLPLHIEQDKAPFPLKGGGCLFQSKRHPYELVQYMMTGEGGLFAIAMVHFRLPVTGVCMEAGEDARPSQRVDALVHSGSG